jgi:DNA-binding response OmpR family regulator
MAMTGVCFVNGQGDRQWVEALRQAVESLGKSFVPIDRAHLENKIQDCELIILDAGAIGDDLGTFVKDIRTSNAQARIVVVSSAPHWKEARQILLAGATDYVRKTNDSETMIDILLGNVPTLLNRSR